MVEKIRKTFSLEKSYRICKLFFFDEVGFKQSKDNFKSQNVMVDEIAEDMVTLATAGIEKRVTTLSNEISY